MVLKNNLMTEKQGKPSQQSGLNRGDFDRYMLPVYAPADFIPVHGKGSRLWDTKGREYIDFAGGIAVNALGHAHPAMVQALQEQANQLWHVSNIYTNLPALSLAKKLVDNTFADKVFFANSGAEANEAALKLARKIGVGIHPNKTQIISFTQSFHGRTLFTVTVGGQPKYSQDFAPLPTNIVHAIYNDIESVKSIIGEQTCAVIVEPIQGEGGVIPADMAFLRELRNLCDEHQAALIFDEVQTGMGRTGKLYAYMHGDVEPDILTTAKSLGGGFPIGAMLTTDRHAKQFAVGDHGTTYGGNPLACAVANVVFDVINQPQLLQGVCQRHEYFMQKLHKINEQYKVFAKMRGQGLLLGCLLNEVHAGRAKALMQLANEEGLLCLMAGSDVLRLTPSLLIEYADIDDGMARLAMAIEKFVS